jgi:hypothetical protein
MPNVETLFAFLLGVLVAYLVTRLTHITGSPTA